MSRTRIRIAFAIVVSSLVLGTAANCGPVKQKRLIEFGWDEPDTAFMREHVAQLEASPFDGCVFHINAVSPDGKAESFTWLCWSKRAFSESHVQRAIDDLKQTPFKRFTHNFLRFNTTPADIDWFDDYSAVVNNARLAAKVASDGHCKGLLFDIEQYNAPLFQYKKQRDAATKSWDVYAAQVRKRGREVMEAFQAGYPGLTVFLTFGYSLPWRESGGGKKPLADCGYGLLAPFLDGLVDGARGRSRLVDGHESAYGYMEPSRFPAAYKEMKHGLLPIVADPSKFSRVFSFSFGIWIDRDWRNAGWNTDDPGKNPHTPEKLEPLVRKALETADEYVWIYTETPRWWSPEGTSVKLPPAYDAALRRARTQANASRPG
jgi:hypothetical protein